ALRLHAGMLALANGLPTVLVGHDTRTYSFCQMLGLEWTELLGEGAPLAAVRRLRAALEGDPGDVADVRSAARPLMADMAAFLAANGLPSEGIPAPTDGTP